MAHFVPFRSVSSPLISSHLISCPLKSAHLQLRLGCARVPKLAPPGQLQVSAPTRAASQRAAARRGAERERANGNRRQCCWFQWEASAEGQIDQEESGERPEGGNSLNGRRLALEARSRTRPPRGCVCVCHLMSHSNGSGSPDGRLFWSGRRTDWRLTIGMMGGLSASCATA